MISKLMQRALGSLYLAALIFAVLAVPLLIMTVPQVWTPSRFGPLLAVIIMLVIGWAIGRTSAAVVLQRFLLAAASRSGLVSAAADRAEVARVNIIRIVAGLILLCRSAEVMRGVVWTGKLLSMQGVGATFMLLCGFALTVGMATPLFALLATLLMALYVDGATGTLTLGTFVFMMPAMVFTFLPAGTTLSLDAWLARRSPNWERFLRVLYRPFGAPTAERSAILRFLALLSYGFVCLYSATFHYWHDTAWQAGDAILIALTNSFLSRHFDVFVALYNNFPGLALSLSRALTWSMIVWEGLLLPLMLFSRWSRITAICWGLIFFLTSRFLLLLSYLPYYEFALWALLFLTQWRQRTIEVYFDDRCNLCDRTMRVLMALDAFDVIVPRPLSASHAALAARGIGHEAALKDLYGHDPADGTFTSGYDFYIMIASRLVLLLPLYPVFLIGRTLRFGPTIYRFIADRRTRLFGVCQFSTVSIGAAPDNPLTKVGQGVMFSTLPAAYCIATLLFFISWLTPSTAFPGYSLRNSIDWASLSFGLARINVFNEPDLITSANFVVAFRINRDGTEFLVPYTGLHGERLGMDNSDFILYGVSLPLRRQMSGIKGACYNADQLPMISSIMHYDTSISGSEPATYRFRYYYQAPLTKAAIDAGARIGAATASCSVDFDPATGQRQSNQSVAGRP